MKNRYFFVFIIGLVFCAMMGSIVFSQVLHDSVKDLHKDGIILER